MASSAKRERDPPGPAAAAADPVTPPPPLTRWDHLFPAARLAGEQAQTDPATDGFFGEYMDAFERVILDAFPDLSDDEQALVRDEAWLACCLYLFDADINRGGMFSRLYNLIETSFRYYPIHMRYRAVHQLRRAHRHSAAWSAVVRHLAEVEQQGRLADERMRAGRRGDWLDPDRKARGKIATEFAVFIREVLAPEIERTRFDASQVERHMAMAHRVPADVSNLIGQFATDGISTQTPIPLRLQVKHKLELLTRRIASLTPAQTAVELRLILADVEESLPEDERTPKKART